MYVSLRMLINLITKHEIFSGFKMLDLEKYVTCKKESIQNVLI